MKYDFRVGSFAVGCAAILWSLDGLLRRQLFDLPATVVVFWEHVFGFAVLLPVLFFAWKGFSKLTKKQWVAIGVVAFLSGALGTVLYTSALAQVQFISFSVVVLLQQLQPLFAIGMAALLLKEPLPPMYVVLVVVGIVAAYGTSFPDFRVELSTGSGTIIAALLAIGAAAAWGTSTAISKYSLNGVPSLHVTVVRFGFTPLFALLMIGIMGDGISLSAITSSQWLTIFSITFTTGMAALALYYFGLKRVMASRSALIELIWPVSSLVVGHLFLGEAFTVSQWVSAGVLLLVVFLTSSSSLFAVVQE